MTNKLPQVAKKCILDDVLKYEQPTKYIVESTNYDDSYTTPVLTAGKSFIIGYTNETEGICNNLPVIIFDDFTTSSQYVDFPFKVKSSAMKILHATDEANIKYLYYLMQTIQHKADTHKRYWISEYSQREINLPSKSEQNKIVEKIEEEFGKIDEGVEKLKSAQEQITQYRQSVLKSAFDGKLYKTTEWEENNITNICELKSGNTIDKSLEKENGKIPYVKVGDMNIPDNIEEIITSSRFVNLCDIKEDSLIPIGAIIFPKRGGAIATNKKRKVIKPIIIDLNTMAIIPKGNILSELLYYFMIKLDLSKISNGGAVPQINHYSFENIKINLPTINEQKQIVKEIEKRFEVADEVERVISENLEKAEQLKQSILKKAFEGRLVPQDPTDKPASELLAQIQTERKNSHERI